MQPCKFFSDAFMYPITVFVFGNFFLSVKNIKGEWSQNVKKKVTFD